MKKNALIIAAIGLAVLGVGTIYAVQKDKAPAATIAAQPGRSMARVSSNPASSNVLVPQGTAIAMRLQSTISTKTALVGDRFKADVTSPVHVNGRVAIPEGSDISGHVILARQPGKASGRGELQLS